MTSSLVGSEMCIRDRLVAAITGVKVGLGARQLLKELLDPKLTTVTVSYTHPTLPTICSV
eukprot:10013684-Prorocentrum_lima.AAC.1